MPAAFTEALQHEHVELLSEQAAVPRLEGQSPQRHSGDEVARRFAKVTVIPKKQVGVHLSCGALTRCIQYSAQALSVSHSDM